jgi:hypothetical protein
MVSKMADLGTPLIVAPENDVEQDFTTRRHETIMKMIWFCMPGY